MIALECPKCGAAAPPPPGRVCEYCRYVFAIAPGAHSADGFALHWLTDRVSAAFGAQSSVQIAPRIDPARRLDASQSYARGLAHEEPVAALWAPSPGIGWAMTQQRFCWSTVTGPREIAWRNLTPDAVSFVHPSLSVQGVAIPFDDANVARALAELLRLLAMSAAALPKPQQTAPKFADEFLHSLLKSTVGPVKDLYYWPDIPREKETAARAVHGASIHPAERMLALYDTTWFGAGDEGWVLTSRVIASSDSSARTAQVKLENIVRESVFVNSDGVVVQMAVTAAFPESHRGQLADFFRALAKY
ncbi:MAG: hypothetical protein Q8Q09_03670 [Deltaproteobacteria bacterium]|nr:hypothetical protein [Deltaproteobacteria bacterium]